MTVHSTDVKVAGRFLLERRSAASGDVVQSLAFHNLITDTGLHALGQGDVYEFVAYLSSSNEAESTNSTAMSQVVASKRTLTTKQNKSPTAAPWTATVTYVWDFAPTGAAYNVASVGVGLNAGGSQDKLFSRALVKDSGGLPVVLSVLGDEYFRLSYTLELTVSTDTIETVVNTGISTHTVKCRPFSIASSAVNLAGETRVTAVIVKAAPFPLVDITQSAYSGNPYDLLGNRLPYAGDFKTVSKLTLSPSQENHPTGIGGFLLFNRGAVYTTTQVNVTPPILKTGEYSCNLTFEISWGRA